MQKELEYSLSDEQFISVIKKALPDHIKIIKAEDDFNGQRCFVTFWINDQDYIKWHEENCTWEEFLTDYCEEYEKGL
tara:strand:+ start:35 stop:265 length:231 start_codon:yes stop_codon:yes gene_type:complete